MRRHAPIRLLALIASAGMAAAPPPPSSLTGIWSGGRTSLTIGDHGSIIQSDCARGKITDAITPDSSGSFTASGYFNELRQPGMSMQLADVAPRDHPARFSGIVKSDRMQLSMQVEGKPAIRFTLTRGTRIKFVRCL